MPGAVIAAPADAHEGAHEGGIARANWAVPWSDLMMTMFVLFAALLAAQSAQQRVRETAPREKAAHARQGAGERERERVNERVEERVIEREHPVPEPSPARAPGIPPLVEVNVLERSRQAVREASLQNAEIVLMHDQSVKVSVQGPMFFALGKAELRPEVTRFLERLAGVIRQTPYEVNVIGHTDDLPIATALYPSNWELSLSRASQVARYLIRAGGLDPRRFVVMGRGEYEPAAANAGENARALNRRVEIVITRTVAGAGEAGGR
ncbi:MAG: flagellar motor protein MotB [Burkholderiales bacterium]|nr:flagellar motor protein MotB [Burkholderiales bacterium]